MEQINLQSIRRQQKTLEAAWQRWDTERSLAHDLALRDALTAARRNLAEWQEAPGAYAGHQGRLLHDQIETIAALMTQDAQQRQRGY